MPSLGRVLVVDDDPHVSSLLRDALVESGYTVEIAATGPQGLERVSTWRPDVVLLDLWLPGASGEVVLGVRLHPEAVPAGFH